MKNNIFILAILLFIASCKEPKNYRTTIIGCVRDYYTKDTLPFLPIHVIRPMSFEEFQHGSTTFDSTRFMHTVISDIHGRFSITFDDINDDYCSLFIFNDTLLTNGEQLIKTGQEYHMDIYTKHTRILKLHVNNSKNIYDKISFNIIINFELYEVGINDLEAALCGSYVLKGFNKDTIIYNRTLPDGLYRIRYTLYKNNKNQIPEHVDMKIYNNTDTVFYDLKY